MVWSDNPFCQNIVMLHIMVNGENKKLVHKACFLMCVCVCVRGDFEILKNNI